MNNATEQAMAALGIKVDAPPMTKFEAVCQWNFGRPSWAKNIIDWLEQSGFDVTESAHDDMMADTKRLRLYVTLLTEAQSDGDRYKITSLAQNIINDVLPSTIKQCAQSNAAIKRLREALKESARINAALRSAADCKEKAAKQACLSSPNKWKWQRHKKWRSESKSVPTVSPKPISTAWTGINSLASWILPTAGI